MSQAWAICDRCGFKHRHSALRKEWTGLLVCRPCFDKRPPDTRPPKLKPEGLPVRDARPEPEPVFRDEDDLGGDDL
jgi:hypothetical protein